MKRLPILAVILCAFQEPAPAPVPDDPVDRVLLSDRTELQGEITGYDPSGYLEFKDKAGGRTRRIATEEVSRLHFSRNEQLQQDAQGERLRLFFGGVLSGKLKSFDGKVAVIESPSGSFRILRRDIRSMTLAGPAGSMPELREEKKDILIREVEKREAGKEPVKENVADYGELRAVTPEKILFKAYPVPAKEGEKAPDGPPKDLEVDRAAVRQVFLHHEEPPPDMAPGWFARILFRNGDKLVGVLQGFGKERVKVFSHLFGASEIEKKGIHSVTFVRQARMTVGNIIVCDQNGIRELTRQNQEVWTYTQNAQHAWNARKLENGNVLVANTNYNQVIEVRPTGKTGGEVVWQLNNCNFPYDALRLENGNTLVAEYYANRVVEYDAKTKQAVWQCHANYPMSIQRLPNGNTMVCSNRQIVEMNKEGQEKWRANTGGAGISPFRAQRLENGNTLVTDQQRGQVVEIDADSKVVWKMTELQRPVQAIRLDDGNTLILEQGQDRIIEVDPANPKKPVLELKGLNYPQGMSTY